MSTTERLLHFSRKLEQNKIVDTETALKIRTFIRRMESTTNWELFMIIGAIFGALFMSAGVFAIISHNWDGLHKHVRGALSIVPALVALYFYYRALFHHKDSRPWIEASSLFLMLMIGASIALVSQTYQMDGDFTKFIKVWMILTIPLFYFARASGIALFYLFLSISLVVTIGRGAWGIPVPEISDTTYWYWLLVLAFLPHYYLSLNRESNRQGIRVVYLSYCLYISTGIALALTIKSNYLLWFTAFHVGFYLLGKRFMSGNYFVLARPFQWMSQFAVAWLLLAISNEDSAYYVFEFDSIFNYDSWNDQQTFYFMLLLIVLAGLYFNYFRFKDRFKDINYLVVFAPAFILFAMIVDHYTLSWWWLAIPINLYILLLGFGAMVQGSSNNNVIQMVAGLLLVAILLWARYFDSDLNFIVKGIAFMVVGGLFFLINMFVKDKVEDIERHKKMTNED